MAFHRGGSNLFPSPRLAAIDSVQVSTVDQFAGSFTGPLPIQDAWKALPKMASTFLAQPFTAF